MQGNYSSVFGVDFDIHLNNYHDLMFYLEKTNALNWAV